VGGKWIGEDALHRERSQSSIRLGDVADRVLLELKRLVTRAPGLANGPGAYRFGVSNFRQHD
jgi:hypothetical protein